MRKHKIEKHFIITFLSRDNGIKGIALMKEDGPVQGMDCGGIMGVIAKESQLKKLTKEGVQWEYVTNSRKPTQEDEKGASAKRVSKTVRTTTHRR